MKRLLPLALANTVMLLMPLQCLAGELTIPEHTVVPLVLKYPIYSNTARAGDVIPVAVAENVLVKGALVFKQGDSAVLYVDKSKRAKAFGRGGKIDIRSGSVKDATGQEHPIQLTQYREGDDKASAVILPIISLAVLWPLAFFAFKHGEEASIPAGTRIAGVTTVPATMTIDTRDLPPMELPSAQAESGEDSEAQAVSTESPVDNPTATAPETVKEEGATQEIPAPGNSIQQPVPDYLQKYMSK